MWEGLRRLLGLGENARWWDERVTYKEYYTTRTAKTLFTAPRWLWHLLADQLGLDSNGDVTLDSSGQKLVKEASAATISSSTGSILTIQGNLRDLAHYLGNGPMFTATGIASTAAGAAAQKRHLAATLSSNAGGDVAAADLVPALAGYKACMRITGVYSDQTDASMVSTITATSGLAKGPGSWDLATVAAQVTDYSPGVVFKATAANEAIQLSAVGTWGNTQTCIFLGEYWYEAS